MTSIQDRVARGQEVSSAVLALQHSAEALDTALLRQAFGCVPSGVVGVCALVDGVPTGMAASTFVPVSLDPPLVAFCVQETSNTWPKLHSAAALGISVLGASHDLAARQLASKSSAARFDGLSYAASTNGAVFIEGASAWIECSVHQIVTAGDHGIVLLRVDALTMTPDVEPLIFHGSSFRQLQQVRRGAA